MSGHKNVIELNGKLYDSVSGKIVGKAGEATGHHATVVRPQTKGKAIDGFVKKPSHIKPTTPIKSPVHPKSAREAGKSIAARNRHQSKTLIRKGLKKPARNTVHHEEPKAETTTHHSPRLERAKKTLQSPKISRFGAMSHNFGVTKKHATLHVKPSPNQLSQAAKQAAVESPSIPIPDHNQVLKEQLVARAIKDARVDEPHHAKPKKHRVAKKLGVSPKIIHFGVGTFAAILLAGFIAYQNAPNISMKIASSRAGFNASIPGYKPAGFGLSGPIEYGPGQITLNFKSNSDDRNFHITQRASNWNSEALLGNFVATNNKSYQTFEEKGRTIYIYDGSNATWVSGGIWYQIEGNSSLSSDQLVRMASSI